MPFQLSLTSRSRSSRGVISSFSAGDQQFATCAIEVTLTATVIGDLTGHNILWEQLTGDTQIVFVTPTNQLTATYNVIGGGSNDRIFRFYIDKGTPLERFDDVTVWGTPTETTTLRISSTASFSTDTACRNVACGTSYIYYGLPAPSLGGSFATDPTTNFLLTWGSPTCIEDGPTLVTVVQNNNGNMTLIGTFDIDIYSNVAVSAPYDVYYLSTTYTVDGNTYTQPSCRINQTQPSNTISEYITDTVFPFSSVSNSNTVYYTLTTESTPESTQTTLGSSISTSTTTYYTLLTEGTPESISTNLLSMVNTNTTTYFSNNGIGG